MIDQKIWEKCRPQNNPFLSWNFFYSLLESQCIGTDSGWDPEFYVTDTQDAFLYTFFKSHSYGEFIFDWSWAEAYQRYHLPYYPKFTSMIPFTPVTSGHFLMRDWEDNKAQDLLEQFEKKYLISPSSSAHFLFITPLEKDFLSSNNYLIRDSFQYHFINSGYESFDHFLSGLKSKKAKHIREERLHPNLIIKRYTGQELKSFHAKRMYHYYLSTISGKNSFAYLNERFFELIFESMNENILFIEAHENNIPIAGSLFFFDQERIFGRYWGTSKNVKNLHFELCYYQGIDFCIERKLKVFEAGAQGEHKISRGFRPVRTYSAHKLKEPGFHNAISDFIEREKDHVTALMNELEKSLPFRRG